MSRTVIFDNPSRVATPEELAPIARLVLGMADRAVTAFDYTAEEIGRAHGEDAAHSWRTEQSKAQRRHVSGRRGRRVVVFGVFAAIVVGVFVAVANDIGLL